MTGRCGRQTVVVMQGGALDIEWRESDNHVYLAGPATLVYEGDIELPDGL